MFIVVVVEHRPLESSLAWLLAFVQLENHQVALQSCVTFNFNACASASASAHCDA